MGCYVLDAKSGVWRITTGSKSPYVLIADEGKNRVELPLKIATSQELTTLSNASGAQITEGLSMIWPPDAKDTKPVGIYRVKERDGKEALIGYFFIGGGYLTRTKC